MRSILTLGRYEKKTDYSREALLGPEGEKALLEWIRRDKSFIDSLSISEFGIHPGEFRITRWSRIDGKIVVRLFAPSRTEHRIFGGVQIQCLFYGKPRLPREVFISPVPWEN